MTVPYQILLFSASGVVFGLVGDVIGIYPFRAEHRAGWPARVLCFFRDFFFCVTAGMFCLLLSVHTSDGMLRWYHILPFVLFCGLLLPTAYRLVVAVRSIVREIIVILIRRLILAPGSFVLRLLIRLFAPLYRRLSGQVKTLWRVAVCAGYIRVFEKRYQLRQKALIFDIILGQKTGR